MGQALRSSNRCICVETRNWGGIGVLAMTLRSANAIRGLTRSHRPLYSAGFAARACRRPVRKAPVAELVDALDSKSSSARSAGSIPARGTSTVIALLNFSSSAQIQNSRFSIRTEQPDQRHLGSRRFGHELSPLLDHDFSSRFTIVADDLDRSRSLLLPLPAPLGPLLTTLDLALLNRALHVGIARPRKSIFRRAGLLTRYYLRSG